MLTQETLKKAIYKAIVKGSSYISDDVLEALQKAYETESNDSTKMGLKAL